MTRGGSGDLTLLVEHHVVGLAGLEPTTYEV
jgi:hypothetical protein